VSSVKSVGAASEVPDVAAVVPLPEVFPPPQPENAVRIKRIAKITDMYRFIATILHLLYFSAVVYSFIIIYHTPYNLSSK
jgi:hypothetical protein